MILHIIVSLFWLFLAIHHIMVCKFFISQFILIISSDSQMLHLEISRFILVIFSNSTYHSLYIFFIFSDSPMPHPEISSMSISQSVECPLTTQHTAVIAGSLASQNGTGHGTIMASVRRIMSHRSWAEVCQTQICISLNNILYWIGKHTTIYVNSFPLLVSRYNC